MQWTNNAYIFTYRKFTTRQLSAKANIEQRKNSKVYGLIVKIKKNCEKLDKKEGLHHGLYYKQRNLKIKHCNDNIYKCFSYIMCPDKIGNLDNPSKIYRKRIMWELEEQKILFSLFDKERISVSLTDSCTMLPRMSRSGIFGLKKII